MADKVAKGRHQAPRGEAHGRAKLSNNDIDLIRNSTTSANELGAALGVHPQHVRLVRRQKRIWLHV
jgi:hypothetical protein